MHLVYRLNLVLILILLLPSCFTAPAPATSTAPPTELEPTQTPEPSPTLTLEPGDTATPTPVPSPTIPAAPVNPVAGLPQGTDGYPWWNDTVFYEIFVRSFYDADGDGIGDFKGIIEKLDYLNDGDPATTTDLGISGLWLMPIHPSPSYHGYDVTDYYDVNPEYGTLEDFRRLLDEAHARGIRIVIDWVLNHTSSRHPWFEQAQNPASPYRDWYRWSAQPPPMPGWHPGGGGDFYFAFFWVGMPDLNYTSPAVVAEMKNVARFWLQDVGIDGFRLDAAKHIFEDGTVVEHVPATHDMYKELRAFYKNVNPKTLTVGEIWSDTARVSEYVQGDELDLAFDFDLAKDTVFSAAVHRSDYMSDRLVRDIPYFQAGQFATFLTNHDQDRVMSVLNGDVDAAKSAAALLLTAPGVPFVYYGEEIGMLGKKPDEDIRLPLQWSAEPAAGFTTGEPWRAPGSDFGTKNIEAQSADPESLLSLYRRLIQARNEHAALRVGDYYVVETGLGAVYAGLRVSSDETILVLINLSSEPLSDYALDLPEGPLSGEYDLAPLLDAGTFASLTATDTGGIRDFQPIPTLPPYGRFILQLQATAP